jgi:hypothetical protein
MGLAHKTGGSAGPGVSARDRRQERMAEPRS